MYYGVGWKRLRALDRSRARARKKFPLQRFQRAEAQLQLRATGEIVPGRVFLHDLREAGISLFLAAPLPKNEEVYVVITQPRTVYARGRIEWCGLYRLHSPVITAESFQYRAYVRFEFDSDEERKILARYLDELAVR